MSERERYESSLQGACATGIAPSLSPRAAASDFRRNRSPVVGAGAKCHLDCRSTPGAIVALSTSQVNSRFHERLHTNRCI